MIDDIERARKGKPFRAADLIVYAVVAAITVGLFLAFTVFRRVGGSTEIIAELGGERVFSYSIADGKLTLNENFSGSTEMSESDGGYIVVIYGDKDRSSYNVVVIENGGKTYVSDADCSNRKDCVHMKAVDKNGGVIICVPHGLKIYATGDYSPTLG